MIRGRKGVLHGSPHAATEGQSEPAQGEGQGRGRVSVGECFNGGKGDGDREEGPCATDRGEGTARREEAHRLTRRLPPPSSCPRSSNAHARRRLRAALLAVRSWGGSGA